MGFFIIAVSLVVIALFMVIVWLLWEKEPIGKELESEQINVIVDGVPVAIRYPNGTVRIKTGLSAAYYKAAIKELTQDLALERAKNVQEKK